MARALNDGKRDAAITRGQRRVEEGVRAATLDVALMVAEDHCNGQVDAYVDKTFDGWALADLKTVGAFDVYAFSAGEGVTEHPFDESCCDEIWILRSGRLTIETEEETYEVTPESPALIPAHVERSFSVERHASGYILQSNERTPFL